MSDKLESLQTDILQAILSSLAEGFVVFDAKGICSSVSSQKAAELFGEEPLGRHICDLMHIPEAERVGFIDWYEFLFTPGVDFANIVTLGPAVLEHPSLHIAIKYRPIVENDRVTSVAMIFTDLTTERAAMKESENLRVYADMLKRFFADRENFVRVLQSIRSQLEELKAWKMKHINDHGAVLRQFHNIKALTGLLSAADLLKSAHDAESALVLEMNNSNHPGEFESMVHTAADMVLLRFNDFIREHSAILGLYQNAPKDSTIVSSEVLQTFYLQLRDLAPASLTEQFVTSILMSSLRAPFEEMESHARVTAKNMGRSVSVHLNVDPSLRIFGLPYRKLFDSLFHLINNSLDHGFDSDDMREKLGKPKDLQLNWGASLQSKDSLKIYFQDDGSGIDPEQIRQKLYEMHVNCSRETDAQVIYHIFDPGFSTKKIVSAISGRGMGMDAVHFEIKKLGGKIELSSEKNRGTRFEITLPYLTPESGVHKAA